MHALVGYGFFGESVYRSRVAVENTPKPRGQNLGVFCCVSAGNEVQAPHTKQERTGGTGDGVLFVG